MSPWSDAGTSSFRGNPRCRRLAVFSLSFLICQRRAFLLLSGACVPGTDPFQFPRFLSASSQLPVHLLRAANLRSLQQRQSEGRLFVLLFFSKLRIPPSYFPVFLCRAAGSTTTVDFSLTFPCFLQKRARRDSRPLSKLSKTRPQSAESRAVTVQFKCSRREYKVGSLTPHVATRSHSTSDVF